jgi:hypothetical protein
VALFVGPGGRVAGVHGVAVGRRRSPRWTTSQAYAQLPGVLQHPSRPHARLRGRHPSTDSRPRSRRCSRAIPRATDAVNAPPARGGRRGEPAEVRTY